MSVRVSESCPVSSPSAVLVVVGPVIGLILIILLLLLWRYRHSKDLCCRLIQTESSSQSSDTNHGADQTESHTYSSLLHGNSSLYDSIQPRKASENVRCPEPEEGAVYVNVQTGSADFMPTQAEIYIREKTRRNERGVLQHQRQQFILR
uniref:Si:dkey-10h3.2 n=1 Tax=Nothobranchius rachovii TaxID=451742 RepID=A0A1A8PEM5_9TELE